MPTPRAAPAQTLPSARPPGRFSRIMPPGVILLVLVLIVVAVRQWRVPQPPPFVPSMPPGPSGAAATPLKREPSSSPPRQPSEHPRTPEPRPRAAAAKPPEPRPAVDTGPVLDPFFAALDAECQVLAVDAAAAYAASTTPATSPDEIDAQIKTFLELKVRSDLLAGRLQQALNNGIAKLGTLNLSGVEAHRLVLARIDSFHSLDRMGACQSISMFAKYAAALFTEMKPHRAKIRVNEEGSLTTTDEELNRKLFSPRSQTDAWRGRSADALNDLTGGTAK